MKELREIVHRVALAKCVGSKAGERTDVHGKAVVARPIAVDVRLRLRPGSIEQRQETMVQDIEKPAERRIARMPQALARVLGQVQGQRPIRAQQAEEPHLQARRLPVVSGLERRQRRRRERQIGILAKPDRFIDRPKRSAPARLVGVQTLQPPQRLIEVVVVRLRRQRCEQRQSVGRAPQ